MRAGERWPGKLPLLRRLRKDEYGGYALGPQEVDRLDWEVRSFVYACLVEHGLPPPAEQTLAELRIEPEQARAAYERLQGQDGRGGGHDPRALGRVLAAMISRPPSCREPPAPVWPAITIAVVA